MCLPRLQVHSNDLFVEKDEHGSHVALLCDETSESRSSRVVPHFDVVMNQATRLWIDATIRGRRRGGLTMLNDGVLRNRFRRIGSINAPVSHIHHQRVLQAGILLNQEYSLERLAEEPLTLLRDVMCSVSATPASLKTRAR